MEWEVALRDTTGVRPAHRGALVQLSRSTFLNQPHSSQSLAPTSFQPPSFFHDFAPVQKHIFVAVKIEQIVRHRAQIKLYFYCVSPSETICLVGQHCGTTIATGWKQRRVGGKHLCIGRSMRFKCKLVVVGLKTSIFSE